MSLIDDKHCIETELKDILTLNSCTTVVSELIKFILYRKQQLPYTFDRLKYVITKRNSSKEKETIGVHSITSVERHFKVAEERLATLELLFEKTREELANSNIKEVVLLFGSTPMCPKQVYWIHLPEICLNHSPDNHPERNQLFHLLQSVILSNNLTNMLTKPMNLTNMYMFIKKINKDDKINQWFTPKFRYQIPNSEQQFHIKIRHPQSYVSNCSCKDFKIFSDDDELLKKEEEKEQILEVKNNAEKEIIWYQANAAFKGFSDEYVNGVSVTDLWLR